MLEFKTYRNSTMNQNTQRFITNVFMELSNRDSFHTNLQLMYNNSLHFQTIPYDICTRKQLRDINKKAFSTNKKLIVQGDIHSNHHASGVLIDAETGQRVFTEDTYIRVKDVDTNEIFHILLNPPKINHLKPILYYFKSGCGRPSHVIPPIYNFY